MADLLTHLAAARLPAAFLRDRRVSVSVAARGTRLECGVVANSIVEAVAKLDEMIRGVACG